MKVILPANSRVVIRQGDQFVWYDSRRELVLDSKTIISEPCPVRNIPAAKFTHQNVEVWCLREQLIYTVEEEQLEKLRRLSLYVIEYDIPQVALHHPGFIHPMHYLHRIGIRTSRSVWVIPEGQIPWQQLNQMTEIGAVWYARRVHSAEYQSLYNTIVRGIARRVNELVESTQEAEERASERLERQEGDPNKAAKRYTTNVLSVLRKNLKMLQEIRMVATVFGMEKTTNFDEAVASIESVRAVVKSRAKYFAEALEVLRNGDSESQALANTLEESNNKTYDSLIAADFLEEHGHPELAQDLRESFSVITEDSDN